MKSLALSLLTIAGTCTMYAGNGVIDSQSHFGKTLSADKPAHQYRGHKPFSVNVFEESLMTRGNGPARVLVDDPSLNFEGIPNVDYMEGPDGNIWYYTAEYDVETVVHNPYWTETVLHGFTFTIYDNSFNKIGTVKDVITLGENETRAREVLLDTSISAKFFNTDDKYEVMVFHVMNTEEYINHYYYKVYSIGGEKDADGNDVAITTMEGRCVEAVNLGDMQNEDYYYTFVTDPVIDTDLDPKTQGEEYVNYLNTLTYTLTTYKKATATEGPSELFSKGIYVTRVPGDTTDGVYFISKKHNGKLYMAYSQYEKPYFVEPVVVNGDESATPDNSLVIEVYATTGGTPEPVSTTKIPVETPDQTEALVYAYYSIGSVAWERDIDMTVNGSPEAPAFIVAHDIHIASLDETSSNYEIYGNDGQLVRKIAEDTESLTIMAGDKEEIPMVLFVLLDDTGEYHFRVVNLYSGEELFTVAQQNDGDPLLFPGVRVKTGDDEYNFVFVLQTQEIDGDSNNIMRVIWFNEDGTENHVDYVNMGQNVQAAQLNLDPIGLRPDFYDTDEGMEYAVLVKRTYGVSARNEFIVVDDSGDIYGTFTADDGRGEPSMFTLLPGEPNRIMMCYTAPSGYLNVDLYDLPFVNPPVSGIESIESADSISGNARYYNLQGLEVNKPENGVFIKVEGGKATKVFVK